MPTLAQAVMSPALPLMLLFSVLLLAPIMPETAIKITFKRNLTEVWTLMTETGTEIQYVSYCETLDMTCICTTHTQMRGYIKVTDELLSLLNMPRKAHYGKIVVTPYMEDRSEDPEMTTYDTIREHLSSVEVLEKPPETSVGMLELIEEYCC